MAGIYLHIPFCKQACNYCNFHFSTSLRYKNELLAALLKEIELTAKSQGDTVPTISNPGDVETIYFGGGTPSLLAHGEIRQILDKINLVYPISSGAEITLEANPDDINVDKLTNWKQAGINRLSIGVQSFFEEDLQWMNRAHNSRQAHESLELASSYFDNITMDLIYGGPGLSDEKWKKNVETAISYGINHLSCYALTVEPKTPLQKLIQQHRVAGVDAERQSSQFLLLMDWLAAAGYEHYEISNFARPGYRSRHNSSYWQGKHYLGFGPSAHSFDGLSRWWNVANNNQYIRSIEEGIIPSEKEVLTPVQRLNEYIMISLRTMEGLQLDSVTNMAGNLPPRERDQFHRHFQSSVEKYRRGGMLTENNGLIQLTKAGKLLADGIAGDLFADQ